jgi:hypothetical protein
MAVVTTHQCATCLTATACSPRYRCLLLCIAGDFESCESLRVFLSAVHLLPLMGKARQKHMRTGADSVACIQLWSLHEQCHQLRGWGVVYLLYLLACALQYRYLNNMRICTAMLHATRYDRQRLIMWCDAPVGAARGRQGLGQPALH